MLLLGCLSAHAAPICRHDSTATALSEAMAHARFIAYQPTQLQMVDGRATQADDASITDDLTVLRSHFDALITYGALHGAEHVPDIAAKLGFKAVIVGVWDVSNDSEVGNAIAAWRRHPQLVVGLSLGNEAAFGKRATFEELARAIDNVRTKAPGLALSTTEPFHLFLTDAALPLMAKMDFMLANVHPVFQPWFATASDETAAQFVVNVVGLLAAAYCGPILVKETGVPTAPAAAGYSRGAAGVFLSATAVRVATDRNPRVRVLLCLRRALARSRQPPGSGPSSRRSALGALRRGAAAENGCRRCADARTLGDPAPPNR